MAFCELDELPMEICSFPNLDLLFLHSNHLTSFPDCGDGLPLLTTLRIGYNPFKEFPPAVAKMLRNRPHTLRLVHFGGCPFIETFPWYTFAFAIGRNCSVHDGGVCGFLCPATAKPPAGHYNLQRNSSFVINAPLWLDHFILRKRCGLFVCSFFGSHDGLLLDVGCSTEHARCVGLSVL